MAPKKEFVPLLPPTEKRPPSNFFNGAGFKVFLRDQLTIEAWLCLGAAIQGLLLYLFGVLSLIPALSLLLYRTATAIAQSQNWIHNPYLDNIIPKKFAAAFPDDLGNYGSTPASSDVVVFLIGARVNHPLGLFAPGMKELGEYFPVMAKALDARSEEFGFLGSTTWLNSSDRETCAENMTVCYFRTVEGLHKFAHDKVHRDGWDWWNRTYNQHKHISIWHETYHVPKGHWESIYVNSHLSGINATAHRFTDKETGGEMWARPVVDASKGLLKTSAGRMSRSERADEHEKYGQDPYDV